MEQLGEADFHQTGDCRRDVGKPEISNFQIGRIGRISHVQPCANERYLSVDPTKDSPPSNGEHGEENQKVVPISDLLRSAVRVLVVNPRVKFQVRRLFSSAGKVDSASFVR
jgi:hypothetical protein